MHIIIICHLQSVWKTLKYQKYQLLLGNSYSKKGW